MKIGVLGTGTVGATIASKLVALGHEVIMGSRTADNPAATSWAATTSGGAAGTFADAAAHGELVFHCASGSHALDVITAAGIDALSGKTLIDVANPLDFSKGFPPSLIVCNTDSLAEQIQRAAPGAGVVKALNTLNCAVMVDPARLAGDHVLPVCGNDAGAKAEVTALLGTFGWPETAFVDLGDLSAARGMEMYVMFWVRLYGTLGTADFNLNVVRAAD